MKKQFLSFSLLAASVLLISCVKQVTTPEPAPVNDPTFTDMKVPADFDWKMTQNVTANFTSAHQTLVFVSLPDGAEPFASFFVGGGLAPMTLNIPTADNKLIVRYQKEDGLSAPVELSVMAGAVSYAVPSDSKVVTDVAPQSAAASRAAKGSAKSGYITIPSSGWGTLMFEDLYPNYGDYDFNDMVINYNIKVNPGKNNMISNAIITVRVAAVGGLLPYDFYIQLNGVRSSNVNPNDCFAQAVKNASGAVSVEKLSENKNDGHFACKVSGIKANKKLGNSKSYVINTSPNQELKADEMVSAEVQIFFTEPVDARLVSEYGRVNFFIAQDMGTTEGASFGSLLHEIHCAGYAPSSHGDQLYATLQNSGDAKGGVQSYTSKTNLVWAIDIPMDIPHMYECNIYRPVEANGKKVKKSCFIHAYYDFQAWAESGGKTNTDWYKNYLPELLVPLK
ncbi:MAG: LruC domain-containing protein [Mucinivorans sp.]